MGVSAPWARFLSITVPQVAMAFKYMSLWTSGWVYLLSCQLGPDWLRLLKTFLKHFFSNVFFHRVLQIDQSQAVISYCEFLLVLHISVCVPFLWIILTLYWGSSEAIDCLEMCVCIYIYMFVCIHIYVYVHMLYTCICLFVSIHLWLILLF